MSKKVTQKQAEAVLAFVADWMGRKGYGTPICPEGRTLGGLAGLKHEDDGSWCDDCTFGPAPTGRDAAYNGMGPMLNMEYEGWSSTGPNPTILLEGGPDEWAIRCSFDVQKAIDAKRLPLWVEPQASYALNIYRND